MNFRLLLPACAALTLLLGLTPTPSRSQVPSRSATTFPANAGPFAPVPYIDPAYRNLGVLQDAGLVSGFSYELGRAGIAVREPAGTYSSSGYLTPCQIAFALRQAYPWPNLASSGAPTRPVDKTARRRAEAILSRQEQALEAFRSLVSEFRPVLEKLGQDVPAVQARLTALTPGTPSAHEAAARSFPDVSKTHWAYSAVEVMCNSGILVGYPDGVFQTSDGHD